MLRPREIIFALVSLLLVACATKTATKPVPRAKELLGAPRITAAQLRAMQENQKVVILDVRSLDAYSHSKYKITGAIYADPAKIDSWSQEYPKDKPLVLY